MFVKRRLWRAGVLVAGRDAMVTSMAPPRNTVVRPDEMKIAGADAPAGEPELVAGVAAPAPVPEPAPEPEVEPVPQTPPRAASSASAPSTGEKLLRLEDIKDPCAAAPLKLAKAPPPASLRKLEDVEDPSPAERRADKMLPGTPDEPPAANAPSAGSDSEDAYTDGWERKKFPLVSYVEYKRDCEVTKEAKPITHISQALPAVMVQNVKPSKKMMRVARAARLATWNANRKINKKKHFSLRARLDRALALKTGHSISVCKDVTEALGDAVMTELMMMGRTQVGTLGQIDLGMYNGNLKINYDHAFMRVEPKKKLSAYVHQYL